MGRFKSLVDSEEGIENFRAQYRIPPRVGIRYCKEGQWSEDKQEGEVVILMIAFIEGRMRILIGTITKDYLRAHRLAPTQCAPNMFRILGCVDALNEKMGLGLTHHDVKINKKGAMSTLLIKQEVDYCSFLIYQPFNYYIIVITIQFVFSFTFLLNRI